ncbi:MAG TPA: hypothetical protein DGT23_19555 [Micromonosporaceae bacterium]|nr:hypothetical protein [Micromonosporaceae bacterium]
MAQAPYPNPVGAPAETPTGGCLTDQTVDKILALPGVALAVDPAHPPPARIELNPIRFGERSGQRYHGHHQ